MGNRGLVEHQSTPNKLMPFRMSKYMNAIFDYHLKKTKGTKLPVIYPLIFYSGKQKYRYSTDLFDLFEENKDFAMEVMLKPFQLIDLSEMSDEQLKQNVPYGFFARVMKHAHEKNKEKFMIYLREIIKDLGVIESVSDIDYVYVTLSYVIETYDVLIEEVTGLVKENLSFIGEEKVMTLADRLRKEGYQKGQSEGVRLGMEKGVEKGVEKGIKMVAINLLCQGVDVEQVSFVAGLSINEIQELKNSLQN